MTAIGDFPYRSHLSLAVDAFKLALDDAGMTKKDIDGLIVLSYGADYDRFLEATGVEVRYAYQGWSHGRFIAPMLQHAALVVASGMARNIAIVHGRRRRPFGPQGDHEIWLPGPGPNGEAPYTAPVGPGCWPRWARHLPSPLVRRG